MGLDDNLGLALAKAQQAAGHHLPAQGTVFISVRRGDKGNMAPVAAALLKQGFSLLATPGTANRLEEFGIQCERVNKISQGRPHILDKIKDGQVQWIVNTSSGSRTTEDSYLIRRAALDYHIPYTTTITGAVSMAQAIIALAEQEIGVKTVQEFSLAID